MKTRYFCNFYFFYFTTIGVIVPYWGLYLKYLGFNAAQIGELMAILLVTKVVTPNLWAIAADRIAAKRGSSLSILSIATGFTLIIFSAMLIANQYWSVALVMFAYCIFWNACLPQVEAATLNHLNNDRERYGNIRLWGSLGFIVTVLLVGELIDKNGVPIILPAAIICMSTMFIASLMLSNRAKISSQSLDDQEIFNTKIPIKKLLNKSVVTVLILCFFMQLSHAPFYSFFSIYLENYGYSKFLIGVLWTVGVVFEIGVFLIGYRLLRRFSLVHLLTFTFLIAAIRWYLVAAFPESIVMILISQTMHAITYGLYHIVMIQLIDRFFVGRYQIRGQALYSSITFGLGGAVGSILSGYIWSYFGPNELFYYSGVMMFLVMLVSAFVLIKNHSEFNVG